MRLLLTILCSFLVTYSGFSQVTSSKKDLEAFLRDIANADKNSDAAKIALDSKRRPKYTSGVGAMISSGRFKGGDEVKDVQMSEGRIKEVLGNAIEDGGVSIAAVEYSALLANEWILEAYNAHEEAKKTGVGVEEAQKRLGQAYQYIDVLRVDSDKTNGFDDIRVRNMITREAIKLDKGPQGGAETDAFMTGYLYGTLNMPSVVIPRGSQTGDMDKDFEQAKKNLTNFPKDRRFSFLEDGTPMSMNDALAIMKRATDGKDDSDISKQQALQAGALVSLYYQQETNICYNGVKMQKLK